MNGVSGWRVRIAGTAQDLAGARLQNSNGDTFGAYSAKRLQVLLHIYYQMESITVKPFGCIEAWVRDQLLVLS